MSLGEQNETPSPPLRTLTLLIVRHGVTAWNAEGRLQGQTDVPLASLGREQARLLGRRLAIEWGPSGLSRQLSLPGPPVALYSSDLERACETANIILAESGLAPSVTLRVTPLLRERDFGEWEGLTLAEAQARFGPGRSHHNAGESHAAVHDRVQTALAQIWSETMEASGRNKAVVLIVGHGGSLRHIARLFDGSDISPSDAPAPMHLDNTGLCELTLRGETFVTAQGSIAFWNDTSHLIDTAR